MGVFLIYLANKNLNASSLSGDAVDKIYKLREWPEEDE
jgi:hypothetical protein